MTYTIRELDPAKATLAETLKTSELITDTFQHDSVFKLLFGPRYSLPVPPPAGQIWNYRKNLWHNALARWLRFKAQTRRDWVMEAENGDIIAYVSWTIPRPLQTPLSIWRRIKNWALGKCITVVEKIMFFGEGELGIPARLKKFLAVYAEVDEDIGWLEITDQKLAHYSPDDLRKTLYHPDNHWWCNMMVVSSKYQKRGYGSKLFNYTFDQLDPFYPEFADGTTSIRGPAKFGLYASREGRRLYETAGFELKQEHIKYVDGLEIDISLYVKTVA